MTKNRLIAITSMLLVAWFAASIPAQDKQAAEDPKVKAFEELCAKIQKDASVVSDAEIIKAIDTGKELGKPYVASLAVKNYLAVKLKPSEAVVRKAIENAVLTGDHQSVVARAKMYLRSAKPSAEASEVAATLYRTQIDYLDTQDNAYQFMAAEGGKFRQSLNARKFDKWFVDQAEARRDCPAM